MPHYSKFKKIKQKFKKGHIVENIVKTKIATQNLKQEIQNFLEFPKKSVKQKIWELKYEPPKLKKNKL